MLSVSNCLTKARAAGPERGANGDLFASTHRAGEKKVREIRAGDQKNEPDGDKQHHQRAPRFTGKLFAERHDVGARLPASAESG